MAADDEAKVEDEVVVSAHMVLGVIAAEVVDILSVAEGS